MLLRNAMSFLHWMVASNAQVIPPNKLQAVFFTRYYMQSFRDRWSRHGHVLNQRQRPCLEPKRDSHSPVHPMVMGDAGTEANSHPKRKSLEYIECRRMLYIPFQRFYWRKCASVIKKFQWALQCCVMTFKQKLAVWNDSSGNHLSCKDVTRCLGSKPMNIRSSWWYSLLQWVVSSNLF